MGGMLFGTIFGVIIIPGLYYIFGSMADGRKMIKDEESDSLTDNLVHSVDSFSHLEESEVNEK
jgi:HAE1 family hydrophobic/amphiphilic exporter-1